MDLGDLNSQSEQRDFAHELVRAVGVLRRRWRIIISCVVLAAAAALAYSLTRPNEYTAKASLLFGNTELSQTLFGNNPLPAETDPTREAATNTDLVTLETVAGLTSRALGGRFTPAQIVDEVSAQSDGQSDIVTVAVTDRSPQRAALIANTYAQQFITFRVQADRANVLQAQQLMSSQYQALSPGARNSSDGRALASTARQLEVLAALQTGNAQLVQQAGIPAAPSSPKPLRNTILAAFVGLLIGIALAFLIDRLDRRVRNAEELEELAGLPMLAAVPLSQTIASHRPPSDLAGVDLESFRLLRTRLRYFSVDREIRTVLVTSAAPGEGKTTVATNLAAAAAGMGSRVLLVEADLRRPTLARELALGDGPGLAELLTRQDVTLEAAIRPIPVGHAAANGHRRTLEILPAGAIAPNPLELLESRKMEALLSDLSSIYDFVVLDTPPTSLISDALPLVRRVDGAVVVSRIGQSTRDGVAHCLRQLRELNAPLLGFVANAMPLSPRGSYTYAYGYGGYRDHYESAGDPESVAVVE